MIIEIGRFIPQDPMSVAENLSRHGLLTLALDIDGAPTDWRVDDRPDARAGTIGLLFGADRRHITHGRTLVIAALLRLDEFHHCLVHGSPGRAHVAALLAEQNGTVSDLQRTSVL